LSRERPTGWMGGDAPSRFHDVAGNGEFVGGCADVSKRVMQDKVFEMDELSINPHRGMRLEKMRALKKALADGHAGPRPLARDPAPFSPMPAYAKCSASMI
jgi:hypothetical protein